MNYLLTAVVFVLVFSLLILVHEFGHFIVAKRSGIKIEEFGIGLPPRIWGKRKKGTIYSINWIPFGGFVRMLGEDTADRRLVKRKDSFVAQPMRVRFKVIIAGVLMNFVLAWILLTTGLTVGMQPLILPGDILSAVNSGVITLQEGVKIKDVTENSLASSIGLKSGDLIYSVDRQMVDSSLLDKVLVQPLDKTLGIVRNGKVRDYKISEELLKKADWNDSTDFGLKFDDFGPFPRVKIYNLPKDSDAYRYGLRPGDIILSINDLQIYNISDYESLIRGLSSAKFEVYHGGLRENIVVEFKQSHQLIISEVLSDSPAQKAGVLPNDIILSVNGKNQLSAEELIKYTAENSNKKIAYRINRGGKEMFFTITPKDGKVGILLSELINYAKQSGISLYNTDVLSSIKSIEEEKYPVYQAAYKSIVEGYRLSKATATMFVDFVANLISMGKLSENVAGPVGIYQMTHVLVQEGFIPVLRFVAILSLSLGVINVLPLPALDGGRLLFIFIELVVGRRVNYKWEAAIHTLGYLLILLLILIVTYNDILRFFNT